MRNTGEGAKPPLRYSLNLSAHFRVWVTVWVRQLTHILTHTFFSIFATKSIENRSFRCFFGAAGQIRTADLILTNSPRQGFSFTPLSQPIAIYPLFSMLSRLFPSLPFCKLLYLVVFSKSMKLKVFLKVFCGREKLRVG